MDTTELQKYFRRDKSDWYYLDNAGQKVWDLVKVNEFWELIKTHKMAKKDYNFDYFVFPKFQTNGHNPKTRQSTLRWDFWEKEQVMEFEDDASFVGTKFLAPAIFSGKIFKKVKFVLNEFDEGVHFSNILCKQRFELRSAKFNRPYITFYGSEFNGIGYGSTTFTNIDFGMVVDFRAVKFYSNVRFVNLKYNDRVLFDNSRFTEPCEFLYNDINKGIDFVNVLFLNKILFKGNNFSSFKFDSINRKDFEFKDKTYPSKPPIIEFVDSYFNENCVLSNTSMNNISFDNCDVSDLSFKRCDWIIKYNRLIHNEKGIDLKDREEHYRQLKRNFDNKKDWEMSGFAYVSEMEVRQKRLRDEKKYYYWFIYWFYGFFGRYTQDIKRPIISLSILIILFSSIYFFIDYSYLKALQRGIKGAIPYILIDTVNPFKGYWLILRNVEFLLGGTFFTFFILALRKKFKQ